MKWVLGAIGSGLLATLAWAGDVPGSLDLPMVDRPDGALIVRFSDGVQTALQVPLDRVQRVNNRIEVGRDIEVTGFVTDVTYELTPELGYRAYVKRIQDTLVGDGAELLWSCESRACGVSGLWANSLFKVRELYGPNGNQLYFAVKLPGASGAILTAYGIEQGNRRQYVHLRLIEPNVDRRSFEGANLLLSKGRVVLPILFAGSRVSPESRQTIEDIAANLRALGTGDLAIVAYTAVTPGGGLADALSLSAERARHVQELLADAGLEIQAAHGLGALVPSNQLSPERVEIVKYR